MAANLGLVAHATEGEADEFTTGGLGDRFGEGRLADARRADEADDRARSLFGQLTHGEKFEDAVFDLVEAVVVRVEDFSGFVEVAQFAALFLPRHVETNQSM